MIPANVMRRLPIIVTASLVVLLYLAGNSRYYGFNDPQVVLNLLIDNAFLLLVAVGMTFVILTGGIDLSVGAVAGFTTMFCAWLIALHGWPAPPVLLLALVAGTAGGFLMGCAIHYLGLQPFIVTLAGLFLFRGLAFVLSTDSVSIQNDFLTSIAQTRIPFLGSRLSVGAVLALLAGTLGGFLMGCAIHYLGLQPFIVTLAGLFLFRGLAFVIETDSVSIQNDFLTSIAQTRIPILGSRLSVAAVLALAAVAVAAVVLRYTRFGRNVFAVGGNEQSALLMGLPVARTKIGVYTLSGFCSALAGLAYLFYTQSGDAVIGIGLELDAIAVVVIGGTLLTGGTGNVLGTLLGVLVLGLVKTIISFEGTLSSWWTKIFVGSLLLAFILLQRFIRFRFRAPGEVV